MPSLAVATRTDTATGVATTAAITVAATAVALSMGMSAAMFGFAAAGTNTNTSTTSGGGGGAVVSGDPNLVSAGDQDIIHGDGQRADRATRCKELYPRELLRNASTFNGQDAADVGALQPPGDLP